MYKGLKLPQGAMTERELLESRLERYISENGGAAAVAAEAGISKSMMVMIRNGQRHVSAGLADLLGFEPQNLRFYVPRGGKNHEPLRDR
jgi:hypothetical protein